jgi:predicted permease
VRRHWHAGCSTGCYGLLPFITFLVALARADLTADAGVGLLLAYVALTIVGVSAWLLAARVLKLEPPATATVVIASMLGNTGFFGLPLVATLLGHHELGAAVTFDGLVSGPMLFVVAFAIVACGDTVAARLRTFVTRNPPLIAVAAALVAPDELAPDALVDVARAALLVFAPVG